MEVQYSKRSFYDEQIRKPSALNLSLFEKLLLIKINVSHCLICNDAVSRVMITVETQRLITSGNDSNMIVMKFVG